MNSDQAALLMVARLLERLAIPYMQLDNARGVLALNAGLDHAYVSRWAAQLGVADLWGQLNAARG